MSRTGIAWSFVSLAIVAMLAMFAFVISIENAKEGPQGENGALRYFYKSPIPNCVDEIIGNKCDINGISEWDNISINTTSDQYDRVLYGTTTIPETITGTVGNGIYEILLYSKDEIEPHIGKNITHTVPTNIVFEGELILRIPSSSETAPVGLNGNTIFYLVWMRLEYSNIDTRADFEEVWAYAADVNKNNNSYIIPIDLEKFNHIDSHNTAFETYDLDVYFGIAFYSRSQSGIDQLDEQFRHIEEFPGEFIQNQQHRFGRNRTNVDLAIYSTSVSFSQYGEVSIEGKVGEKGNAGAQGENGALRWYYRAIMPGCAEVREYSGEADECSVGPDGNTQDWGSIIQPRPDTIKKPRVLSASTTVTPNTTTGIYEVRLYDTEEIIPDIGSDIEAELPFAADYEGEIILNAPLGGTFSSVLAVHWQKIVHTGLDNTPDITSIRTDISQIATGLNVSNGLTTSTFARYNSYTLLEAGLDGDIGLEVYHGIAFFDNTGGVGFVEASAFANSLEQNTRVYPAVPSSGNCGPSNNQSCRIIPTMPGSVIIHNAAVNFIQWADVAIEGRTGATGKQGVQGRTTFELFRSDSTTPSSPGTVQFNTVTRTLNDVTGWVDNPPARIGTETIYVSRGVWDPAVSNTYIINITFDTPVEWAGVNRSWAVSTTAPSNPTLGDGWYDTATSPNEFKVWNGASWATISGDASIPDNSITTAKIVDGSVTNSKVANGINGGKLQDSTLPLSKLNSRVVTGFSSPTYQSSGFTLNFTTAGDSSLGGGRPVNWPSYETVLEGTEITGARSGDASGLVTGSSITLGSFGANELIELYFYVDLQNIVLSLQCPDVSSSPIILPIDDIFTDVTTGDGAIRVKLYSSLDETIFPTTSKVIATKLELHTTGVASDSYACLLYAEVANAAQNNGNWRITNALINQKVVRLAP